MNPGATRIRRLEIRSKLFVPGSRPELFQKAAAGAADSLSFDLEDSVLPEGKEKARLDVAEYLAHSGSTNQKVNIVRVNSFGSGLFNQDIEGILVPGLHVVNLPKAESRDEILSAVAALESQERKVGLGEQVGILANIETPKGLRLAFEIATAHPRVVGLQIGMLDFSLSCGIAAGNATAANAVRFGTRLAASEAGISVFDGAFAKVNDPEGFRVEAEAARALGLNGKSCIHPSQVPIANAVFFPTEQEIDQATRLIAAAEDAQAKGAGAFLLDGAMVDVPVLERARGVLARVALRASRHEAATG